MSNTSDASLNDIAVIGMAGRFPGANSIHELWQKLELGQELLSHFRPEEVEPSPLVPEALRQHPDFVRSAGVLAEAECFDHDFFGVSPREAAWMDPQQRVFLECAWAALEDAAYVPSRFPGKIALYAGAGASGHLLQMLAHTQRDPASLFEALGTTTAENLATKASFKLGLRGESLAVYTACSTGLVAVHLACQSLLLRQSDIALAGAVKIALPQKAGYLFQEGMIFSPDGRCRAFDADARGTVSGSGAGVVVLKPLADALRDRDHVYAVIKGSAINNDGARKVGFTAPSVEGQAAVISEALSFAGVSAEAVGYVEAHGTGTPIGDPIEVAALTRAYRQDTDRRGYCAIGSVKSNLGHLDTAAGIAGFMKAALALHQEAIPPTLHFQKPNPALNLGETPFSVVTERRAWPRGATPRHAAVSSFGIGGTNAHAVLGEAPAVVEASAARPCEVVTLSARTEEALEAQAQQLAAWLSERPQLGLADVAFTRNVGRQAFDVRRAIPAANTEELVQRLQTPPRRIARRHAVPRVAFLFPGQGAQSAGMAAGLYRSEPRFRAHFDEVASALRVHGPALELKRALFEQRTSMDAPALGVPALFAVEVALGRTWIDLLGAPAAYFGHSYGEYAAAHLAGVLTLSDAARLAVVRGQLIAAMAPGRMLMVALSPAAVGARLPSGCSLAALNGRERTVVSGPTDAIDSLRAALEAEGIAALPLPATHAFHSAAVEPLMAPLRETVASLRLSKPNAPIVSSLTGDWVTEALTSPDYWARQMREPVRFIDGLDVLLSAKISAFLEVGPDQALTSLVRAHVTEQRAPAVAIASMRRTAGSQSDESVFAAAAGALWEHGVELDWARWYADEPRRRISLPTYPFARTLCRLGAAAPVNALAEWQAPVAVPTPVVATAVVASPPAEAAPLPDSRASLETAIIEIWRERLGPIEIARDDNFLELGGNSLMAAQLLTRLRDRFRVQLPLSDLFEAPTVAGIADRIEARLQTSTPTAQAETPPLAPVSRSGPLAFSVVQERVWWMEKLSPGNPALNMPLALRLRGRLDVTRLRAALDAVVARHEALRTLYPEAAAPTLQVLPALTLPLPVVPANSEAEALRLAREDAEAPFALHRDPPIRARLVRRGEEEHLLLVTVHHIVSDTWSMVALTRELLANYQAFVEGASSTPLPALAVQYVDYAHWQRRCLSEGAFADQENYWRERLADLPPPLPMPTDRPRDAEPSMRSTRRVFDLPRELAERVNALAQAHGVTPFMVLLAGFKAVLARYAGATDVVVGTPIGNRSRGELEPLIGYVAHAIPLRTDLSGNPTFRALLERVKETTLGAYAHPDVPYEHFVREIEPEKDLRRARPFDALFILHAGFQPTKQLPGLELELVDVPDAPAQFGATLSELSISMGEGAAGYHGTLEYAHALYDPETIDGLLTHWEQLLTAACEDPSLRLHALPLQSHAERQLAARRVRRPARPAVQFSLSFFANDEDALGGDKYRLFLEGARYADAHGFKAVWTPERHFHSFGGLYPSPALSAAALATTTRRLELRAGSVVLPLHDPLEVAEQWSVVDNLSGGRVGISFASGWHAQDFVLAPDRYRDRREHLLRELNTVRRLWRGEAVERTDGAGQRVAIRIRPRPVQAELPFWLTAAGSPDTFRLAGELGANVLTNLMGQKLGDLQEKIALYRDAWQRAGHGPGRGQVTLMLHAFLGSDAARARDEVRGPLLEYFRSSVDIFQSFARAQGLQVDPEKLTEDDLRALTSHGLERYIEDGGLFGTVDTALPVAERVRALDVDEIACLVDFGASVESTLTSLEHLAQLRRRLAAETETAERARPGAALAQRLSAREAVALEGAEVFVVDDRLQPVPPAVVGELVVAGDDIVRGGSLSQRLVPHPFLSGEVVARTGRRARLRRDGRVDLLPDAPRPVVLEPVGRERDLPLSFAQQRLWYLDQLEPGNIAYNNPSALRLVGALDATALERCLSEVVRRHEILRTTFHVTESGPVQRIAPSLDLRLERRRLDGDTAEVRRAAIAAVARAEAARPFDLVHGPLVRAQLLEVDAAEHVLLLTMHHIVSDGWSAGVLAQELGALYRAFARGEGSPLPALSIQYADYAVWQRAWMQGRRLERELTYWKKALADLPVLQLPTDRPRPAVQTYGGDRVPVSISAETMQALSAVGRKVGATPFMVVLAGFQALLSRHSAQTDFAVGTPVAGRNRPEVEPLVGCFVNTLALRADLEGDPSFLELVKRTRARAIEAFAHQEAPFEKLVDALHLSRELSHTPLVQAMFVLHNTPAAELTLDGLTLSALELHNGATKLDLTLELREHRGALEGGLEFNTTLFERATAERLARHLERLLQAAAQAPSLTLSRLPLLDEAEREALRVLGQSTVPAPALGAETLVARFEATVDAAPASAAIVQERTITSYEALDRSANRIAQALLAQGITRGDRVVIALEDPVEVIAGMLGALKAGAAYVPVDPLHPEERLRHLLAATEPAAIVTRGWLRDRFPGRRVFAVDESEVATASSERPRVSLRGEDVAYVLFTSGSTGVPRGVVVEHRQLLTSTAARLALYPRVKQALVLSPFTFDAATGGIFWTLLSGGALAYPDDATRDDPAQLVAFIQEKRISHVMGVPALYAQLVAAAAGTTALRSLEAVAVGGETCPPELVAAHHRLCPEALLSNEYGPTEATVWATAHRTQPGEAPVPIGRPIPGVQARVLDAHGQLAPKGAPGELHLAGDTVARGYLGGQEGGFVSGERVYRTGDLARWRHDGALEFLGRADGQVKVRGFRIELAEIEAALGAHPQVKESCVRALEQPGRSRRLVAWFAGASELEAEALRVFLRPKLPEYMIPAAFVRVVALPRTAHGKVDVRSLALPEPTARADAVTEPRTDKERALLQIWREVLGLERIGIDDNFFELGGDSILSIQIVTRAARARLQLTPKQIFQSPTIAQLATLASEVRSGPAEEEASGPAPLTPIQRWFFELGLSRPEHWNMSVALEAETPLDPVALQAALDTVAAHHPALRLRFRREGSEWLQTSEERASPVPLHHLDEPEAVDRLQGTLDFAHGPLFAAVLSPRPGGGQRLSLLAHHLVIDGVSWRIVLEDLAAAYEAHRRGATPALPPTTTSFARWARELAALDAGRDAAYWGARPWGDCGPLPRDRQDALPLEQGAREWSAALTAEETRALLQDVQTSFFASAHEALLTALAQTLCGWTGRSAALIDVETHGREPLRGELDVSRTVGWFTAIHPALLQVPEGSPGEALKAVKEQLRAVPNHGVGYLPAVQAGRVPAAAAEVSFNYLGQLKRELAPGLSASTASPGQLRAKDNRRPYLLDVNAVVMDGRLELRWTWASEVWEPRTVEAIAADFLLRLRSLISHCQTPEAGSHSPSDFPLAKVNQAKLDKLAAKFGKRQR